MDVGAERKCCFTVQHNVGGIPNPTFNADRAQVFDITVYKKYLAFESKESYSTVGVEREEEIIEKDLNYIKVVY